MPKPQPAAEDPKEIWLPGAPKITTMINTVLIQSIRRSRVTRGPKSTKSGKVTGHRSWRQNPQRSGKCEIVPSIKFNVYFFVSHVTYNSF